MLNIMVDTSTLFSGLFYKGKPEKVLIIIKQKHSLILSYYIVEEIYDLIKEKFSGQRAVFDAFLFLCRHRIVDEKSFEKHIANALSLIRDKKDAPILACALHVKPDYFVSSDPDFFTTEIKNKINVVTAAEFLKLVK